ncbi:MULTISPECIES: YggS family pyridoxal phosphate-dependent enzyme [unclassified Corynebacterium]|uniref:YggS family pyridoxal phosphate-dependent enzyme n=1 Tax=unclassified Corynebacterium TaxID=2624378 RepID=UPI00265166FF|nr:MULTISPECIES: YggS family pyridoxal phosphate-dependent enzyme [unclassified Corynebacterium]MDN8593615.1 YggS family pyridoxal phosphate-dependent enzyme [Corynebacterium sp. P4_F2]WKK55740.1 YggS family pyridoxal phosphate-dependent enzyme [Corynebacterium sp. P4-C1]WKK63147.1 YggS family pyridoxal phosphate-dependent enzyme [Corynebacterium sp. P8-C1]
MDAQSAKNLPGMTDERREEIAGKLEKLRADVRAAEKRAGREPGSVSILPVTKFHPAADAASLAELGIRLVGENREQEARGKVEELAAAGVELDFAMIGQIQSKKANAVARWASEVHSVDSVKLAHGLDRGMGLALERGDRTGSTLPCLVQLSFDGDAARGGVPHDDAEAVDAVVSAVEESEHLLFDGFMVVPPLDADPGEVFAASKSICDSYAGKLGRPLRLSAGMSGDFEEAIAHGSTVVRVGTGLLGKRPVG